MTTLTLCGCGWLGKQLAAANPDATLIGTTQSADNFAALSDYNVRPLQFCLGDNSAPIAQAASGSTVVLNIPPGARKKPLDPNFLPAMLALIDDFFSCGAQRLIFISTTAVYGEQDTTVTEETPTDAVTPSGKAHVAIENHLMEHYRQQSAVFRLAGLVGPSRHPGRFLAGRQMDKGEQVVNLVHGEDVCRAINHWLAKPRYGEIFHLCSNEHPKRGDYYRDYALHWSLPPPEFNPDYSTLAPSGKTIDAHKSWQKLGLTPTFASPYDML